MTTYTSVFGNDAIPPSNNRFAAVTLAANTQFYWPELATGTDLIADIMEVTASSTYGLTLPEADAVSTGRDVLFRNVGANTFTVKDFSGATIGTVAAGEAKLIYLADNSTAAGVWRIFTFGTGTSAADASALAGYGIEVVGGDLAQDYPTETSAGSVSVDATDRAKALISSNSGAVTYSLLGASTAGDGFFFSVSNQGTGAVTIDPNSTETVDGVATKDINPGESAILVCDGTKWVTVGYGRSTDFQFTKLVLDITSGGPFTLTSTQAQNKLIQFIGVAGADFTVNIPAVVAVYYLQGSWTGGFNCTFKTVAGSGISFTGTDRLIAYCDGVDVVLAQTSAVPATDLAGGVAGAMVYQSGVGATDYTAAGTTGQVLLSGGSGAPTFSTTTSIVAGVLTHSGDVVLSGSAKRITGDFSNATYANRVAFQTSTVNGATTVLAIPNGSSTTSSWDAYANSDANNSSYGSLTALSTEIRLSATLRGTGTYLPMTFWTGGSEKFRIAADTTGTYTFGGTAPRITGDFSNATYANRVMFQTSTVNGASNIGILPNGTSTTTAVSVYNNSDPTNSGQFQIAVLSTDARINSAIAGTGTYLPMTFYTGGSERMRIDTSGNVTVTNADGGLGYGTGAGGTVTQATSRTTAVTLNKPTGAITMFSAAGSTSWQQFQVNNSLVSLNDTILINLRSGSVSNIYQFMVLANTGGFIVYFAAVAGAATDAPVINFAIIKGAAS